MDLDGLLKNGLAHECRLGIGLSENLTNQARRELSMKHAKIEVESASDPASLVRMLKDGDVDGAVRGTLSSIEVLKELKVAFGLKKVMRTAVLEDTKGKQFLLTPVGIDEGSKRDSRLELVEATCVFFHKIGWDLSIGVLSKGRPEDKSRSREVSLSLRDGEWLVDRLNSMGMRAEHFGILVEDAVAKTDLVVAPDGVTGNMIFRSMHFLGGGKAYGAPVVNIGEVFVDTSRAKATYADSLMLAAGLVKVESGLHIKR